MDIDKIISNRRSTYSSQFSGELIDDSVIHHLLENANWAPSHYQTEPWRFKVYSSVGLNRMFDKLADIYKVQTNGNTFSQAKFDKYSIRKTQISHAIVIIVNLSKRPDLQDVEEICATACAIQNVWLTVTSIPDIGGYWSTGKLVFTREFAEFNRLNENQQCLGLFYLGKIKAGSKKMVGVRGDWHEKIEFIKN